MVLSVEFVAKTLMTEVWMGWSRIKIGVIVLLIS